MNNKRPARRAFAIAVVLLTTLAWVMTNMGELRNVKIEELDRRDYVVQLDVRGDLVNDHVTVRDTLNHYLAMALPEDQDMSANWELNYCCEEMDQFALSNDDPRVFQWLGEFNFGSSENQLAFLRGLVSSQHVSIEKLRYEDGVLAGIANAQLPTPRPYEGMVNLQQVKFNLRAAV